MKYEFSEEDLKEIDAIKAKYPEVMPATLPVLWLAQNKFGHVNPEVQRLVASTLGLPEAHVHGVVTFYTQYYEEEKGTYVLDVCTCLTCQLCGGYEMLEYFEEKLGIKQGETTPDGRFTLKEVECLGACGYAPMMQVSNETYVNNLTKEKVDKLLDDLSQDKKPEHEKVGMPQRKNI